WGADRIEIEPTDNNLTHNYLVVLYPANVGDSMPETVAINAASGNMQGAHIKDSNINRVVMFATSTQVAGPVIYELTPDAASRHVLFDIKKNTYYDVSIETTSVVKITVSEAAGGVFLSTGAGILNFYVSDQGIIETPPIISNIEVLDITANSAQLTWVTDKLCTSRISYGTTADYGTVLSNAELTHEHSAIVSGLLASTTYHYQIECVDVEGMIATTSDDTFITFEDINDDADSDDTGSEDSDSGSDDSGGVTTGDEVIAPVASSGTSGGSKKKSGCCIATAAFGTPLANEVKVLCDFRNRYMMSNKLGRKLIGLYWEYSPPFAAYLSDKELLKTIIRVCLRPIINLCKIVTP
ncbi:MAG: fibronectin type III domain-containing protein, partial [Candidatus Omnitrophota bacterium]